MAAEITIKGERAGKGERMTGKALSNCQMLWIGWT